MNSIIPYRNKERIILHLDMDAFFASVEQRDHLEYRNKPTIVGSDPKAGLGRGVVSAASYEARRYGIHSAMPISLAYRKCPFAFFVLPDFSKYKKVSEYLLSLLGSIFDSMEPLSIDEAFVDCSNMDNFLKHTDISARQLKQIILKEIGLTASIGIASNKSVAKIASDLDKPGGLVICPFGYEEEFLQPLPIKKLSGVGKKTEMRLNGMGIQTIGDIASMEINILKRILGKWGEELWYKAKGIDNREVKQEGVRKSISEERTFSQDTNNIEVIYNTIDTLLNNLTIKMNRKKIFGRTISLKIRFDNFDTFTRSKTILGYTNSQEEIKKNIYELYTKYVEPTLQNSVESRKIRLIGVNISNLKFTETITKQLSLF